MKDEAPSKEGRRPYAPPAVVSREVQAVRVFHAACGIGIDYGKFRKPTR